MGLRDILGKSANIQPTTPEPVGLYKVTQNSEVSKDDVFNQTVNKVVEGDAPVKKTDNAFLLNQDKELELYHQWKQAYDRESKTGEWKETPEYFDKLYKSFEPLMYKTLHKYGYKYSNVPKAYFNGRMITVFDKALKTYDPRKGVKLNTWITNKMREIQRDVFYYQDIGRVPANRLFLMGTVKAQYEILKSKLPGDKEPTIEDLAAATGQPVRTIERLMKEWNTEKVSENMVDDDFAVDEQDRIYDILESVKVQMPDNYRTLIEHWFGLGGKKNLSNTQLAKKLGVSESTIKKMKKQVESEVKDYLEVYGM